MLKCFLYICLFLFLQISRVFTYIIIAIIIIVVCFSIVWVLLLSKVYCEQFHCFPMSPYNESHKINTLDLKCFWSKWKIRDRKIWGFSSFLSLWRDETSGNLRKVMNDICGSIAHIFLSVILFISIGFVWFTQNTFQDLLQLDLLPLVWVMELLKNSFNGNFLLVFRSRILF